MLLSVGVSIHQNLMFQPLVVKHVAAADKTRQFRQSRQTRSNQVYDFKQFLGWHDFCLVKVRTGNTGTRAEGSDGLDSTYLFFSSMRHGPVHGCDNE